METASPSAPPLQTSFREWAKVELMGHSVIVGLVTEATIVGGAFLRVDVPAFGSRQAYTRFISPQAIYAINPVSEEVARAISDRYAQEPVSRYELPQIAEKVEQASEDLDDDGFDALAGDPDA